MFGLNVPGALRPAGRSSGVALAVVAAAFLVAGCGSSLTKHDYVLRAEGICSSTLRSLRVLQQPALTGSMAARTSSLAAYLARALPLLRIELRKLNALPHPKQGKAESLALHRYLIALGNTVDELGALASVARSGNAPMVSAAQKSLASNSTSALAAAYGVSACADPGTAFK